MNITPYLNRQICRQIEVYTCLALLSAANLWSQAAINSESTPAILAKYDINRNGKLDPDELAAMQAAQKANIPVENTTAANTNSEQVIALSPFEVISENKGYFSANSMSGTRMNSKIEDLGQSITVMTKEQMLDFAMLDINDVFDHGSRRRPSQPKSEQRQPRAGYRQRQHRFQQYRDHRTRARRSTLDGLA
jgi:outer membrane receptor for ferric coprogen and ferric-rhodotorulic acid